MGGGKYAIKSWEDYVEIAFGKGVKPIFVGDLKTLFSFIPGQFSGSLREENECSPGILTAISGYILQVKTNSIVVITDDGTQYEVKFNKCTISLSSQENYQLTPGDIIVLKG